MFFSFRLFLFYPDFVFIYLNLSANKGQVYKSTHVCPPPPSEVVWMGKLAFMWNLTYLLFMFCIVCIKNSERENKLNLLQTIFL